MMSKNESSNEETYPGCLIIKNEKSIYSNNEDFCMICQKHFCNKYYLKKHKLDVHKTLSVDSLDSNINKNQTDFLNESTAQKNYYNIDIDYIKHLFSQMADRIRKGNEILDSNFFNFINQKETSVRQKPIESSFHYQPVNNHDPSIMQNKIHPDEVRICNLNFLSFPIRWHICYNCNSRFPDELSLSRHCQSVHQVEGSHINVLPDSNRRFFQNIPFLSSQSSNHIDDMFSTNTLDAFKYSMAAAKLADRVTCDICGKDLCNKYFLRTHRKKVHGIKCDALKPVILRRNMSFPIERLEMNDSSSKMVNNKENEDKLTKENRHIHWNQFEFSLDSDEGKRNETELKNTVSSLSNAFHNKQYTFDTKKCKWIRKPLANKVKCEICDRLICNKYFLKTHKYKKHGIQEKSSILMTSNSESNMSSSDCEFATNSNNFLIYHSANKATPSLTSIFSCMNYNILSNKGKESTNKEYPSLILNQKEEPLDLSLPKQSFPIPPSCIHHIRKTESRRERYNQRKYMTRDSKNSFQFYKKLLSKYLGIRSNFHTLLYVVHP